MKIRRPSACLIGSQKASGGADGLAEMLHVNEKSNPFNEKVLLDARHIPYFKCGASELSYLLLTV